MSDPDSHDLDLFPEVISAELHLPGKGIITSLGFNGATLTLDGEVVFNFDAATDLESDIPPEQMLARVILYNSILQPNEELSVPDLADIAEVDREDAVKIARGVRVAQNILGSIMGGSSPLIVKRENESDISQPEIPKPVSVFLATDIKKYLEEQEVTKLGKTKNNGSPDTIGNSSKKVTENGEAGQSEDGTIEDQLALVSNETAKRHPEAQLTMSGLNVKRMKNGKFKLYTDEGMVKELSDHADTLAKIIIILGCNNAKGLLNTSEITERLNGISETQFSAEKLEPLIKKLIHILDQKYSLTEPISVRKTYDTGKKTNRYKLNDRSLHRGEESRRVLETLGFDANQIRQILL